MKLTNDKSIFVHTCLSAHTAEMRLIDVSYDKSLFCFDLFPWPTKGDIFTRAFVCILHNKCPPLPIDVPSEMARARKIT